MILTRPYRYRFFFINNPIQFNGYRILCRSTQFATRLGMDGVVNHFVRHVQARIASEHAGNTYRSIGYCEPAPD
ncbi:hypothetical protein BLA23254_06568 [Burkholderia lata]|uniref:Uncharacterized protein n=1 Tax=Burkholderia lata (strain ATCC 17760 / DSM 23089 / LMG 22485 / NCIMB 9086 / R18194 / 383) TaxID=482957 RepID=A0A6P2RT89_BURL3|nr:hypothetical protein BLA23254_06568 [Burkholderia lata]